MKNILLVCAGGMSTSMLAEKIRAAATARGLEVKVWAVGEQAAADNVGEADVLLVGPQMSFKVPQFQKEFPDTPVAAIDMRAYGMMDGAAVLDAALKLIG